MAPSHAPLYSSTSTSAPSSSAPSFQPPSHHSPLNNPNRQPTWSSTPDFTPLGTTPNPTSSSYHTSHAFASPRISKDPPNSIPSSNILKPSASHVLMFPTRGGVKQRVSIHRPLSTSSSSSSAVRAPMVPVAINSRGSNLNLATAQLGHAPLVTESAPYTSWDQRSSIASTSRPSFSEDGHSIHSSVSVRGPSQRSFTTSASHSDPFTTSHPLSHDATPISSEIPAGTFSNRSSIAQTVVSPIASRRSTLTEESLSGASPIGLNNDSPNRPFNDIPSKNTSEEQSDSTQSRGFEIPKLHLSIDGSASGSILDFNFDSTFSSAPPGIAPFLTQSQSSVFISPQFPPSSSAQASLSPGADEVDSPLDEDSSPSRRDTVKSFADVLKSSSGHSGSLYKSPSGDLNPGTQSSPAQSDDGPSPVFNTNAFPNVNATSKSSSVSVPLLLDLDISGRGPSLGCARLTPDHMDDDEADGYYPTPTKPNHRSHQLSDNLLALTPRHDGETTDEPSSPASASDGDGDSDYHSFRNRGKANLSAQPSINTSPYLRRPAPNSFPAQSIEAGCVGLSASGALKKRLNKLKLPSNKEISNPSESKHSLSSTDTHSISGHSHGHSCEDQSQHDSDGHIEPSPMSSILSIQSTGSRISHKSSSRIARLFSRVTGGVNTSSTVLASTTPRPNLNSRPSQSNSISSHAEGHTSGLRTMKRKGSLSNLLDTLAGGKDKPRPSTPAASAVESAAQPSFTARKSIDLLMRPFSRVRSHTDAQPDLLDNIDQTKPTKSENGPSTQPALPPRLKAKRSFDMLKNKFASGRKSMDDLSAFDNVCQIEPTSAISGSKSASGHTSSSYEHDQPKEAKSTKLEAIITPGPHLLNRPTADATSDSTHSRSLSLTSASHGDPNDSSHTSSSTPNLASPNPASQSATSKTGRTPRQSAESGHVNSDKSSEISRAQSAKEWVAVETMLSSFQTSRGSPITVNGSRTDLTGVLTGTLLPFLKAEESRGSIISNVDQSLMASQRAVLFEWLELIFAELREPQPASRGACLDGVAGILESHFLASYIINSIPTAARQYRTALVSVLSFAVDKLNDKAVYANTLVFAGRMFSLAFFRIEGVARKLLRALPPVKRMSMRRMLDEMQNTGASPTPQRLNLQPFPPYLRELCFTDLATYCRVFSNASTDADSLLVQEGECQVEMSGNWLIRWTASDSDLPFAFYRAYHRQLATYLRPPANGVVEPLSLVSMPGFLFIAASFLDKCDSLVHRSLRSVTTLGPNSNSFNAGESATLAMGAKPKVLELAHRRLVSTALDIVGGSPRAEDGADQASSDADRRRGLFGGLLNLWIRAITKRTSMWDTRSVFLLLDLFDGFFYTVLYTAPVPSASEHSPSPKLVQPSLQLFDIPFIMDVVRRILTTADNTVCVMRTIAFVYSQFEALTVERQTCDALCLDILLEPSIFQHLFLHWNSGVRGYYMRLLVWRLSRLGVFNDDASASKSREVINVILTFNSRLDAIRKRHDALSPESEVLRDNQDDYRRKRSTICSTRGVTDQPWAINELPPEEVCTDAVDDRSLHSASSSSDKPSVTKVVSWLRVVKKLGGSSKPKGRTDTLSPTSAPTTIPEHKPRPETEFEHRQETALESEVYIESPSTSPALPPNDELTTTPRKSASSHRSEPGESPESPTFFKFEFELGAEMPRSDSFDTPITTPSPSEAPDAPAIQVSPLQTTPDAKNLATPTRASQQFSKRASLLPSGALTLLRENEAVPQVPTIPEAFRDEYATPKHAYAIRALAEYEQSLEEEHEWKEKLAEEEAHDLASGVPTHLAMAPELIVPRLAVSWPLSFSEDE